MNDSNSIKGVELAEEQAAYLAARLTKIRMAAEQACIEAKGLNEDFGAINWADIHCIEATLRISDDGRMNYEVLLEEAAPEAAGLRNYVYEKLLAAGLGKIDVRTEW